MGVTHDACNGGRRGTVGFGARPQRQRLDDAGRFGGDEPGSYASLAPSAATAWGLPITPDKSQQDGAAPSPEAGAPLTIPSARPFICVTAATAATGSEPVKLAKNPAADQLAAGLPAGAGPA